MSRRYALPAALLAAAAMPATAMAGPHKATTHKHPGPKGQQVSINAAPNPLQSPGDPMTISGHLQAAHDANRVVVLYHRIAGQPRFTVIQRTRTNAGGDYVFHRADGIVRTNRNWFVTSAGARSGTVHEKVFAEVGANPPNTQVLTLHRVAITGHVSPARPHEGDRVILQQQVGPNGDRWRKVDSALVHGGAYRIVHRFRQEGEKSLRVVLPGDAYNVRSESSPFDIAVEQAQNPNFTIVTTPNQIAVGDSATVSGAVKRANPNAVVTLLAKTNGQSRYTAVGSQTLGADHAYSFAQSPQHNTIYVARIGKRQSARNFLGVRDVVSVNPSSTTGKVGDRITFTGSVLPSKAGHIVLLQRKGDDGYFHTIQAHRVRANSTYTLSHVLRATGTKQFRVVVPGGPVNDRGVSSTVTVVVS